MTQNSQIALNHKVVEVVDCNNVVNCPATEDTSIVTTEPGEQCAPTQVEANLSGCNIGQTSTTDSDEHGELCPPTHVEPKVDASVNLAQSSTTETAGEQCAPTQVEANLRGINTGQTSTTDSDEHGELCPPTHVETKVDASVNLAQSSTTETAGEQCAPTHIETESPPEDSTCCIKTPVSILSINLKLHYYEFNDWLKTI